MSKKTSDNELYSAIDYAANVTNKDRKERERLRFLEKAAQYDGVTGLPNQYYFNDRVTQLIAIAGRHKTEFVIVLIRINEISDIIASLGGKVAEKVLFSCANKLRKSARSSDFFGKYNVDTFFYLIDNGAATPDLNSVRNRLAETLSCSLRIEELELALSTAVAMVRFPVDGLNIPELENAALSTLGRHIDPSSAVNVISTSIDSKLQAKIQPDAGAALADAGAGLLTDAVQTAQQPFDAVLQTNDGSHSVLRAENRRACRRRRVFKRGAIIFNNGYSTVNCTIRDISDGGVRIATDARFVVPDRFELLVIETGKKFLVEKRWQADLQSGLIFLLQ